MSTRKLALTFHPLTPERWRDFETLFGANGACGGCWCMTWRLKRSVFDKQKGSGNKKAMNGLVRRGPPPGILAYAGDEVAGWVAVAPRGEYVVLERSRVLKPIDEQPVWSVSCFFIAKPYRNRGVSVALLKAAIDYVKGQGGTIVEGYPQEPKKSPLPPPFVWTGLAGTFRKAGFVESARRSPTRPIMRFVIKKARLRK